MKTPLTPLEFARRARSLYPDREAVVDGDSRWTYAEFFARCDRWSSALQRLGVVQGDRVAYIAPNTHAQLEAFYAVPQLGAVLVPLNYRLLPSDWVYMVNHSGSRVVCVHQDYLDLVDKVRHEMPAVEHFVALEGSGKGWLEYEQLLAAASAALARPEIGEDDLLTINYTSGTTANPKGVMITHRNAWVNVVGTLLHHPMTSADRYLWTLPMFHANGWTFVWIVTAVGGTHVCLRKVDPPGIFGHLARERITAFCAAPTVLIGVASASADADIGLLRQYRQLHRRLRRGCNLRLPARICARHGRDLRGCRRQGGCIWPNLRFVRQIPCDPRHLSGHSNPVQSWTAAEPRPTFGMGQALACPASKDRGGPHAEPPRPLCPNSRAGLFPAPASQRGAAAARPAHPIHPATRI
jgi:acyl-CoA synthetase (AMP-forming)/AMP-acid ligase II